MGGQRGVVESATAEVAEGLRHASSAPRKIEIIEARNTTPIADDVLAVVAESFPSHPFDRPIHYLVTADAITACSDQPLAVADRDACATWRFAVRRAHGAAPQRARARDCALVAVPSADANASFVDLVAAGCTALIGDGDGQARIVQAFARELESRRDDPIELFAVGASGPARVAHLDLKGACAAIASSSHPVVLFVGPEVVGHDGFERLVAATRRHRAAGIVALAPHPRARVILVADRAETCTTFLRPAIASVHSSIGTAAASDRGADEGVDVAILGAIEIRGSAEPFGGHPLLTELVVYLAMHREGATTSAWETALWPERRMPQQTVANRLSEARRALGTASDGRARLRRSDERHYVVEISTDWDRFKALTETEDDPAAWRRALDLVRGRPFSDLHQGQWVALEGFAIEIEHAVVDCALRLGRHALGQGEPDEAISAAQRALRATPWDERLHRLLMVASDAAGDRAGVEATLRHLALVLEIDGDPLRGVHPETARLYNRLSGRNLASSPA